MGKPWVFTNFNHPSYNGDTGVSYAKFTEHNFIIPDDIFDEEEYLVGELNPHCRHRSLSNPRRMTA
jgi:hypothetical protein